jgi:hypothetical protein
MCAALRSKDWVVYCKPPFDGPAHTLDYLGRYTHRVAISNDRIIAINGSTVCIRCCDRKRRRPRTVLLPLESFIDRFLLHVLPTGFVRIRHFGFLANTAKEQALARCRALLEEPARPAAGVSLASLSATERLQALTGVDAKKCPCCGRGRMMRVAELSPEPVIYRARASPALAEVERS